MRLAWVASGSGAGRAVRARGLGGAALLSCLALGHCSANTRREVAALEDGVDAYRRAENGDKSARTLAVASLPCSVAAVCQAKDQCLAAMAPTTRALTLKDDVARSLKELERRALSPESAEAQALPAKLDDAATLLAEGRAKMSECDQSLAALRAHVAN